MRLTFFHWGLHPWAIYVIVGLSLAFFSHRRKLPLAIRSVLYPFLAIASTASGAMPPTCWRCSVPCSGWRPPWPGVSQMNTGLNRCSAWACHKRTSSGSSVASA